jgi:predicted metal-binding protein
MMELVQWAQVLGAGDSKIISSRDICAEGRLADLCRDQKCSNYGKSMSCPPRVGGPEAFQELCRQLPQAVVVRLVIPASALFSRERRDIMRLLHEIVAGLEQRAKEKGYVHSRAFAGGSCKEIFCQAHSDCRVVSGRGDCRNPASARPSLSGFGINVPELLKRCGWPSEIKTSRGETPKEALSWVVGLILIG